MKIRPVGAELFQADGQTDRQTDRQTEGWTKRGTDRHDEANSIFFYNFANALENRKNMVSHHMR